MTKNPVSEEDIVQAAIAIMGKRFLKSDFFSNATQVKDFFSLRLSSLECEAFCVAFLDNKNSLIACEQMFRGTIDSSVVYPREVLKRALELNAAGVIFAHNHPSGNPEPSKADQEITCVLRKALAMVDVNVIDHMIVAKTEVTSFVERGLI